MEKRWKLKTPPQPLVFCFGGIVPLCGALAGLYALSPGMRASLCLYRGRYYLEVWSPLKQRPRVLEAAGGKGGCLGPARVLYAFYAEHGRELTRNALRDLGALF